MRFSYLDLFSSSSSSTQNITSYFSLNPDLSPPVSASTPSLSQIPSSNSLSAPSVPPGFSAAALNQTSSESTSTHPQSSNTVSSSESIPTAPSPTHPQSSNTMSHSEFVSASTLISINTHPMQTRSKSGIHNPRLHPSLFLTHFEPKSVKQALESSEWFAVMQEEYNALTKNKTWDLVSLLAGRQAIGCKWVFRIKENADGSINRYKAGLIAKGFHQVHGFDFHETFSPVVKLITIRVVLTLALSQGWDLF